MRIAMLILFGLVLTISNAQTFQEICATENTNGTIVDMAEFQGDILATGLFTTICGESTSYVAKWENNSWVPSTINLHSRGHYLRPIGNDLYFATYTSDVDSNWLYKYNGTDLEKIGAGIHLTGATDFSNLPNIYDVVEYQGDLIICGEFDKIGDQEISGIAKWNGASWESIGNLSGNIQNAPPLLYPHQMMVYDDELYVVGNFGFAGGQLANGFAKWNGSNWSTLGNGFNSTVYSIGVYNDEIYAGGDFTYGTNTEINRLAKWSGTEWVSPGFGFMPTTVNDYTFVHTIKELNGELWILGGLKEIHYLDGTTEPCGGIISYDGNKINNYNGGVANNDIEAIIADAEGSILIGGGIFGEGYAGILDVNSSISPSVPNSQIQIYPNPIQDIFYIQSEKEISGYQLHDGVGRLLRDVSNTAKQLNVSDLNNGIYFLTVKLDDELIIKKIIKQ